MNREVDNRKTPEHIADVYDVTPSGFAPHYKADCRCRKWTAYGTLDELQAKFDKHKMHALFEKAQQAPSVLR